jgi:phenylalanyl-tRNA synthetase beta chain
MRPVSNVVDASNYVMLELGKPIHTFDATAIHLGADGRSTIVVRRAEAGERLETLDHVARELDPATLVIADARGPIGIAGIMGGANTEIGPDTRSVVIESAIFDPVSIRRTGQRYGLRSEASLRFEKGQEHRLAALGADRTARLIADWAGGSVALGRVDTAPEAPAPPSVGFRPRRVNRLLGSDLSPERQRALLAQVGIETREEPSGGRIVVAADPQPLTVDADEPSVVAIVPSWRRDLEIEADIAEEVARIAGYETIETVTPDTPMPAHRWSPLSIRDVVRQSLAGAGLTEIVTHALVSPEHVERYRLRMPVASIGTDDAPVPGLVTVTNPLSRDHSILRQHLIGSLIEIAVFNSRHGREDVAIFEIGKGYGRDGDRTVEWWRLGFALTGPAEPASWNRELRRYDLDDAKGIVELLCRRLGSPPPRYLAETGEPLLHPGRTARIVAGDGVLGVVGELHPGVAAVHDLETAGLIVGELAIAGLSGGRLPDTRVEVPPRHPAVDRDLAVIVAETVAAVAVEDSIRREGGQLLHSVVLFDVYRGTPLAPGEKSLAYRLTFQAPDRTLTDEEIGRAMDAVTAALSRDVGGRRRV